MSLAPEAAHRIQQRVGTVVRGKYRLDRLLGMGGMAAVFEATHRNGSRVALKVLHPELARVEEVRNRFLREGYVANRIAHPGVTRVIDDDDDDDGRTVFLVLELLAGETVDQRLERVGGRLPLAEALSIADRALDVLAAAHAQGVVHRDIKPDNLFLTDDDRLKVLDFGIARLLDGTGTTRTGQLMGTPAFMSPEQANGRVHEVDGRTDVWSVGAVMFTTITGAPVHGGATPMEQTIFAATQPARPLESVAPWIARDVAEIVNRALAFEREERWPTAPAMRAALASVIAPAGGPTPAPPRLGAPERPRSSATATVDMPAARSAAQPGSAPGVPTLVHGSVPSAGSRKSDDDST
jgi:serine/threonine-protein kinase